MSRSKRRKKSQAKRNPSIKTSLGKSLPDRAEKSEQLISNETLATVTSSSDYTPTETSTEAFMENPVETPRTPLSVPGKKQVSIRLPVDFHSELEAFCSRIGISLNSLVCVALNEYLSSRR